MQWIAYISFNHIWSSHSGNWLGPIKDLVCLDTSGKVFAWSNNAQVSGTVRPARPTRPARPATPVGGWSIMSLHEWLNQ